MVFIPKVLGFVVGQDGLLCKIDRLNIVQCNAVWCIAISENGCHISIYGMAIPLTTNPGGLFTRWGKILRLLADINTFQGTTLVTDSDNLYAQYPNGTADEALIDGLDPALSSAQTGAGDYMGFLTTVATNTLLTMVNDDRPQNSNTDITEALTYLINQMKTNGDSVFAMVVGCTNSANSGNNGNGVLVNTTLGVTGAANEDLVAEKITVDYVADSSNI